jgi:tRNA wybutosine-synthesizing protein 4
MLKHFNKLQSPLRVIEQYQSIEDQKKRFEAHGWPNVRVQSLWDFWRSDNYYSPQERIKLNKVEVFDEWEDFTLFAAHYFILIADNKPITNASSITNESPQQPNPKYCRAIQQPDKSKYPPRRYGALFESQKGVFEFHGGDDGRQRLQTSDIYIESGQLVPEALSGSLKSIPRMHHTITPVNELYDYLLIGGRKNPDDPLTDCWLRSNGVWNQVENLPQPLYRHSAAFVDSVDLKGVLVFGGRSSNGKSSAEWYFWQQEHGWSSPTISIRAEVTKELRPRFGCNLLYLSTLNSGVLVGGLGEDGTVINEAYSWTIKRKKESIHIELDVLHSRDTLFCRFGASLLYYQNEFYSIGGIALDGLPKIGEEILHQVPKAGDQNRLPNFQDSDKVCNSKFVLPQDTSQPLLIGHSAIINSDKVCIVGGGAICFSFGSCINSGVWCFNRLENSSQSVQTGSWTLLRQSSRSGNEVRFPDTEVEATQQIFDDTTTFQKTEGFIAIHRIGAPWKESLSKRIAKGKPCVFEHVDLGSCTEKWTTDYLREALNSDRKYDIHHAKEDTMLFESKNFVIQKEGFAEFIDSVARGDKKYLRAVSLRDKHKPANFYADFEALATDFSLPKHLRINDDAVHSSVFRISGPINMWLHYDALPNILCQIRGSKRLILFSPADVTHLKIPPGRSSSDINVFDEKAWKNTSLRHTHPYEVILNAGDVLHIPPFWCHSALPLDGMSIAINTFFKTEDSKLYAVGNDTYGNKDVPEYEQGRRDISKAIARFESMPNDMSRFYLQRLADEIIQISRKKG